MWYFFICLHAPVYCSLDEEVKVPDATLSKYTEAEIEALKDLSMEEILTLLRQR